LYEVTGEDAALSLMRVTNPRASAKACRGLSQPPVDANAAPVMQQRQKWRRESEPVRVPSLRTSRGLRGCNAPQLSAFQRTPNYFFVDRVSPFVHGAILQAPACFHFAAPA
jgi:hypothetical protein